MQRVKEGIDSSWHRFRFFFIFWLCCSRVLTFLTILFVVARVHIWSYGRFAKCQYAHTRGKSRDTQLQSSPLASQRRNLRRSTKAMWLLYRWVQGSKESLESRAKSNLCWRAGVVFIFRVITRLRSIIYTLQIFFPWEKHVSFTVIVTFREWK